MIKNPPDDVAAATLLAFPAQPATTYTAEAADFLMMSIKPALNGLGLNLDAQMVEYIAVQLRRAMTLRLPDASTVCGAGHPPLTISKQAFHALHMPHEVIALTYKHMPAVGEHAEAIRRVNQLLDIAPGGIVGPFARYINAIQDFSAGGGMIVVALYSQLDGPYRRKNGSDRSSLSSGFWHIDPSVALIPRQQRSKIPAFMPCLSVAGLRAPIGLVQPESVYMAQGMGVDLRSQIADPVYTVRQVATNSVRPLTVTPPLQNAL